MVTIRCLAGYPAPIYRVGQRRERLSGFVTVLACTLLLLAAFPACGGDPDRAESRREAAEAALDGLAAELADDRPADAGEYAERLQAYLEAHPAFFGAAAALIDPSGVVSASPYVYRTGGGYTSKDLAAPDYGIEDQEWFSLPLSTRGSVWTDPYFDAGGGEVWMITRSAPVSDAQGVFAVVTTDLVVDDPGR